MSTQRQPSVTPDEYRALLTPRKAKRTVSASQQRPRVKLSEPVEFFVSLALMTANQLDAMHPIARGRHRKAQRIDVAWAWRESFGWKTYPALPELPVTVTLTRIARRRTDDHDNLRHAFKHLADQITECLGLTDDATGEIEWRYDQQSLDGRDAGVIIRVEAKEASDGI